MLSYPLLCKINSPGRCLHRVPCHDSYRWLDSSYACIDGRRRQIHQCWVKLATFGLSDRRLCYIMYETPACPRPPSSGRTGRRSTHVWHVIAAPICVPSQTPAHACGHLQRPSRPCFFLAFLRDSLPIRVSHGLPRLDPRHIRTHLPMV